MNTIKIKRLLIANRGEIAVRIMQSAQSMGIHCIALFSDADKDALHVKTADEAWYIGASPAKDSYLDTNKVLNIAKQSQADAIHPGYGFLSENAGFARKVEQANMIWVGPPASAIEAMGSKSHSKQLMEQANVPLVPGYHGDEQDDAFLASEIEKIGFPVLIKASAGGGGKGMRIVDKKEDIAQAIAGAKREGLNSFGDDKLLVEKYISRPRHVEIQVFLDQQGNGVYLFERDCSIQRRHQKVVEEAPAPDFSEDDRRAMGEAALKAAKAIQYEGAGTVEFLYEKQGNQSQFYFMEMNTRLQVEHPVTEMITGQDLVQWQLRVAQGEALPLQQSDLSIHGHSMEVRIYAEDPDNDFLPTTGRLDYLSLPVLESGKVRLDTGVVQGDQISPYYDPMISKLIVWGEDRAQCLSRMKNALQEYQIAGVTTNLSFLRRLLSIDDFANGDVSTHFIEEHNEQLAVSNESHTHHVLSAVAFHMLKRQSQGINAQARADKNSPWHQLSTFRLNQNAQETLHFVAEHQDQQDICVHINTVNENTWQIQLDEQSFAVEARLFQQELQILIDGQWHSARLMHHGDDIWVYDQGGETKLRYKRHAFEYAEEDQGNLTAPMNGTIIHIAVEPGAMVKAGDLLMIMEAMKMEHSITAPTDGTVVDLFFNQGDLVDEGAILVELDGQTIETPNAALE